MARTIAFPMDRARIVDRSATTDPQAIAPPAASGVTGALTRAPLQP
jgi:hypothetical protein